MKKIYTETKCYEETNREPLPDDKVLIKAGSFDFVKDDQIVSVYSVDFDDEIIVNVRNNQFDSPSTDVPERYIWSFTHNQYVVLEEVSRGMSTEVAKPRFVSRDAKPGEYIILKRPWFSFDRAGDIMKVSEIQGDGRASVKVEDHPSCKNQDILNLIYEYQNSDIGKQDNVSKAFPRGIIGLRGFWSYPQDVYLVIENYDPEK